MAAIFIYIGPVLLGSNLLRRRKQFTNPGIVKLLQTGIKFYPESLADWVLTSLFKSIKCIPFNLERLED